MSLNRNQIIFASDMSLRRLLQEHILNAIRLVQTHEMSCSTHWTTHTHKYFQVFTTEKNGNNPFKISI